MQPDGISCLSLANLILFHSVVAVRWRCSEVSWAWWIQNVCLKASIHFFLTHDSMLTKNPLLLTYSYLYSGNRYMRVERCRVTASSNKKRKTEFQTDPEKSLGCLSAYVGNLSWNVTEKDLRDFFKSSNISSIRFAIDKRTGGSRGFCHVDFQDDDSLEKAVAMNQSELQGRPVKVAYSVSNRGWKWRESIVNIFYFFTCELVVLWFWSMVAVKLLIRWNECFGVKSTVPILAPNMWQM